MADQPYVTIRARKPGDGSGHPRTDGTSGIRSATHDISRVSYHLKEIGTFAKTLEDSATRAFPNRGRSTQRYKKVRALLLHWNLDDLFVLPELEDLEKCFRDDYAFDTEIYSIPSDNSHLELMMRIGQLIKEHEDQDTLFVVYYGGHARIDESRQSRWCATRHQDSPWLQWSAIQTLLERSISDVLILLDCCAGAASGTFPNGKSITETISASSWDAIAPDPGRYSFTNALIEVLQDWRHRAFSAAMLHAEILARLKHPRPININGKQFEARSTPVHFMMTANHKAPSIEISRARPREDRPPSSPDAMERASVETSSDVAVTASDNSSVATPSTMGDPSEDVPHVMISLALEDDQRLDLNAWEQWLSDFPALAKYVKVQGVFKSHSTLLLLSMPVMVWDMLPEDGAASFVAFIRSNNLVSERAQRRPPAVRVPAQGRMTKQRSQESLDSRFMDDAETISPSINPSVLGEYVSRDKDRAGPPSLHLPSPAIEGPPTLRAPRAVHSAIDLGSLRSDPITPSSGSRISRTMIHNQYRSTRKTTFGDFVPEAPKFSSHVEVKLERYYLQNPHPSDGDRAFIASNLGVDTTHVEAWFHHRREGDVVRRQLQALKIDDTPPATNGESGPRMILPGDLNELLDITLPGQTLLVDLRTSSEFERSHIYGAINLRAPLKFLQLASPDVMEKAFTEEQSRRIFSKWQSTACMVFYYKGVEFIWECPTAEVLFDKFRSWGWNGQCFVLKGHFREFSSSFGKHIVGTTMTQEAKDYTDTLRGKSSKLDHEEARTRYDKWLAKRGAEAQVHPGSMSVDKIHKRREALDQHQADLEAEFQGRFGDLYQRAREVHAATQTPAAEALAAQGKSSRKEKGGLSDGQAQMVGYLDRGLEKMRQARPGTSPHPPQQSSKLAAEGYYDNYADRQPSDEYVEINRGDGSPAGDSSSYGSRYKVQGDQEHSPGGTPRKERSGFLNKMLRRT